MDFALDERLVKIRPSERQINYLKEGFWGFIHFTVNTYTGREWGDGTENPSCFNPTELDTEQWVTSMKSAGIKGIILTCKHHDGFCLWPSKYTEHSVKHSPYKNGQGDIVRELSDACRKYDMKFGVYLSPWDRNAKSYGRGADYDDYYMNQLEELLTNYGEISAIWLDGACGEGEDGKIQEYDWNRYFVLMRRLQPKAVISICGPDIRWCGNEAGIARKSEWSVVAADVSNPDFTEELSQKEDDEEFRQKPFDHTLEDIGSREELKDKKRLIYYPAEVDVSIRPGWFYHSEEDDQVRTVDDLFNIYLNSVGGNASLLLNVPIMPNGKMNEKDCVRLEELGTRIRESFSEDLIQYADLKSNVNSKNDINVLKNDNLEDSFEAVEDGRQLDISMEWDSPRKINYLVVQERISQSQRVEEYKVEYEDRNGDMTCCYMGTTIGFKKIIPFHNIVTKKVKFLIEDSRVKPIIAKLAAY